MKEFKKGDTVYFYNPDVAFDIFSSENHILQGKVCDGGKYPNMVFVEADKIKKPVLVDTLFNSEEEVIESHVASLQAMAQEALFVEIRLRERLRNASMSVRCLRDSLGHKGLNLMRFWRTEG